MTISTSTMSTTRLTNTQGGTTCRQSLIMAAFHQIMKYFLSAQTNCHDNSDCFVSHCTIPGLHPFCRRSLANGQSYCDCTGIIVNAIPMRFE